MADSSDRRDALGAALMPTMVGGTSVYLTGEDQLRVTVCNALAGVRVQLSGRFLTREGKIVPFVHAFTPASDRTESTLTRALGEGWLLEASVRAIAGTPKIGQTFAVLSIARGSTGNFEDLSTLAAGYVSAVNRIAWPGGPVQGSLEGAGALRSIAGAVPAAGAEIVETVPTGARWELISFTAILTTGVAVAARNVQLVFDDGTTVYARAYHQGDQAASLAFTYTWAQGENVLIPAAHSFSSMPIATRNGLGAGHRIRTVTGAIQAADQWSAIQYLVREWIEGA